jgi:hypothetical protein
MVSPPNVSQTNVNQRLARMTIQTIIGYWGGHVINAVNQYLHPGKVILGVPTAQLITPLQSAGFSFVYILVDKVVKMIFERGAKNQEVAPVYKLMRMTFTILLSASILAAGAEVSFNVAGLAILTNIVATTLLLGISKNYDDIL